MTYHDILIGLIRIHNRFSSDRYAADGDSAFCTMWPANDPPDVLTITEPMEAVCDLVGMDLDEEYACELFDMTLAEAAESLHTWVIQEG